MISEKIAAITINMITAIAIARYLGPEKFGILGYISAFVSLSYPLARLGMAGIITKELVVDKVSPNTLIGTSVFFRFMAGMLLLLVFLVISNLFPIWDEIEFIGIACLLVATVFSSIQIVNFAFEAKQWNKPMVLARLMAIIISAIVKISLLVLDAPLLYFVIWLAAEVILISLFQLIQYVRLFGSPFKWRVDLQTGFGLLKNSWWLILSGLASIIYLKIDQVMIGEMVGNTELGIYSVAVRFSEIWFIFPVAIVTALFPKIIAAKNSTAEDFNDSLLRVFFLLALLGSAIILLMLLSSWFFIPLLFGDAYKEAVLMLNIQIFAVVFVFMRALVSKWILVEDLYRYSLMSHSLGVVLNVALNIVLIPAYGGIGAAFATLVSYIGASYVVFFFSGKTRTVASLMSQALGLLLQPYKWSSLLRGFKKWA